MHHSRPQNCGHKKAQKSETRRSSCGSCAFLWLIENYLPKVDNSFPADYCCVSSLVSPVSTDPKEVQMTRWFMQIAVVIFAAIVLTSLAGMHAQVATPSVAIDNDD